MSRHRFKTTLQGRPISVDMGWDRPLQGFFMLVQREDASIEEESFLYDNLSQEVSHFATIDPYLDVLTSLNITIPNEMVEEIWRDGEENVGNKCVEHRKYENGSYMRIPVF